MTILYSVFLSISEKARVRGGGVSLRKAVMKSELQSLSLETEEEWKREGAKTMQALVYTQYPPNSLR